MALKPIEILKDTISSVSHLITITSVDSLGSNQYKLNTANTLYLRTAGDPKFVTIDAIDYVIVDFSINSYVTVEAADGTDQAVTAASFTIDPPLFVWGNPKMVSAELLKRIDNGTVIWPYMWIVEIGSTDGNLNPASAVKETRNFNIFFLNSADRNQWTIEEHYDNDVYTLENYIEYFFEILKSRRDLFETDSITYTKANYVNFGDYIVDEGMSAHILNGDITGIQLQISIPFIINTCEDITVTPRCPTITETFNGSSIVSPVLSKAIVVQTDDTVPVQTGTILTNTAGSLVVEVSAPTVPAVNTSDPIKTGAPSFFADDDGALQLGRGVDFFNLDFTNPFGTTKAHTGTTGGSYNETLAQYEDVDGNVTTYALAFPNDVMINWNNYDQVNAKVLAVHMIPEPAAIYSVQRGGQPYTYDSKSGWYMWNKNQFESFSYEGVINDNLNYPPLNIAVTASDRIFTNTAITSNTVIAYAGTTLAGVFVTNSWKAVLIRYYTLTELGL